MTRWSLLLAALPLLAGCTLLKVKEEVAYLHSATILAGTVSAPPSEKSPVWVMAMTASKDTAEVIHATRLHEPGGFELMVPQGVCQVFAFADRNDNQRADADEPTGSHRVTAPAGGVVYNVDITLAASPRLSPSRLPPPFKQAGPHHSTLAGAIVSLDDPIFSEPYSEMGYWRGVEFFREFGGNVYFLEPYDPAKIPILFIHGVKGSPRNWKPFIEHLDRSRYQPWFFYYPTAASTASMAHLLSKKLWELQTRHHYERLYITAHSAGGLVARTLLNDYAKAFPSIRLLVSISTPWGGEALAKLGVEYSPGVIPSWTDMQPDGPFIQNLFRQPLPSNLDYYLLFGYQGNRNPLRPNNDGSVTLASQLDRRAQIAAKASYGFNEDHTSILASRDVMAQYQTILAAADASSQQQRSVGMLQIGLRVEGDPALPRPQVFIVLEPQTGQGRKEVLFLNADDADKPLGPIPAGTYRIRAGAAAFRATPASVPVITVAANTPAQVDFTLTPQGNFCGYSTRAAASGETPAGTYRVPDKDVVIDAITLEGKGVSRTLTAAAISDQELTDLYGNNRDAIHEGAFCFFDLPQGDYTVTLHARNRKPHTLTQTVVPGRITEQFAIVLEPLDTPR